MKHIQYSLGYVFTEDLSKVFLLHIDKPGKLGHGLINGVGGKVDPTEMPLESMIREFHEETGQVVAHWNKLGVYTGKGYIVHTYVSMVKEAYLSEYSGSEGVVRWYDLTEMYYQNNLSSNVETSVQFALAKFKGKPELEFQIDNFLR
jgi:8-oxo-dGTP pyrophosphatase MutT (NUDIX family)